MFSNSMESPRASLPPLNDLRRASIEAVIDPTGEAEVNDKEEIEGEESTGEGEDDDNGEAVEEDAAADDDEEEEAEAEEDEEESCRSGAK